MLSFYFSFINIISKYVLLLLGLQTIIYAYIFRFTKEPNSDVNMSRPVTTSATNSNQTIPCNYASQSTFKVDMFT